MFSRLVKTGMWRNTNLTWPVAASAVCYALTYVIPDTFRLSLIMILPLSALIATVAVRNLNGKHGFAGSRVGIWLGDVSFAFYLVQYPIMALLVRVVARGHAMYLPGFLLMSAAVFVLSMIAAAALYHGIDKPIMTRWARKKPKPPLPQPVPAAVPAESAR